MRPEILFKLFAEVSSLPKVGPRTAPPLAKLCGPHVVDLLWHLPIGVVDRSHAPKIAEAVPGRVATLTVKWIATSRLRTSGPPIRSGFRTKRARFV